MLVRYLGNISGFCRELGERLNDGHLIKLTGRRATEVGLIVGARNHHHRPSIGSGVGGPARPWTQPRPETVRRRSDLPVR